MMLMKPGVSHFESSEELVECVPTMEGRAKTRKHLPPECPSAQRPPDAGLRGKQGDERLITPLGQGPASTDGGQRFAIQGPVSHRL